MNVPMLAFASQLFAVAASRLDVFIDLLHCPWADAHGYLLLQLRCYLN